MQPDSGSSPPKDVSELKERIVSRTREFPASIKRILELGFTRPDAIAFGNASSIAAKCELAPSSVSRTVRALGYASFREFRQIYRDHLLTVSRGSRAASADKRCRPHARCRF